MDLSCISASENHFAHTHAHAVLHSPTEEAHSVSANSKIGKNKLTKEAGQSTSSALNKFTSQIRKPPRRKTSPINWFPRKKVDSYLKRKIKMLQEVDGMNLTLDQTLGNSNPHYSRVLREKMAAREAANKAMEARRAALVEASWCRILRAARIPCDDAEAQLLQAGKSAMEAFEAAQAMGVIIGISSSDGLEKILIKPVHRLEREKMEALSLGSHGEDYRQRKNHGANNVTECESLDKILVKHVSRLEKEKMRINSGEERSEVKRSHRNMHLEANEEGGLDQVLVKHKSRLEREKMIAAQQPENTVSLSMARREARERELQEAWGGLSLGNSIKPRLSKLERDKAAWIKAEEEERRQAMKAI